MTLAMSITVSLTHQMAPTAREGMGCASRNHGAMGARGVPRVDPKGNPCRRTPGPEGRVS